MKPIVLKNEKYRPIIMRLYNMRSRLKELDRHMIEDYKYRLDINNPLHNSDFAWLDAMKEIWL